MSLYLDSGVEDKPFRLIQNFFSFPIVGWVINHINTSESKVLYTFYLNIYTKGKFNNFFQ